MRFQGPLAACGVAVTAGLLVGAAGAQQQYPPNGLAFYGETASAASRRALFEIDTNRGSLRTVRIHLGDDVKARSVPKAGTRVGTMTADAIKSMTLRVGHRTSGGGILLLHRDDIRVTYFPGQLDALRVSGLRATHVEIQLRTPGHGPLIIPRLCPGSETFTAVATRAGAASPANTKSSTSC